MRDWKQEVRARVAAAEISPERAGEIEDELAQHLRDRYEELRAQGVDAKSAEAMLLSELDEGLAQELQRVEKAYEASIVLGGGPNGFIASLWQDVRYGARSLRNSPGFTAVCLISLALGIGANTAIFQLLNAVRLRTLPVPNAQQLAIVTFKQPHTMNGNGRGRYHEFSYAQWRSVREHQQAFEATAAWGTNSWNLANGGEIRYAQGMWVSGEFFNVLQQKPWIGRLITPQDDQPGCATGPVVISYSYWQRQYGGAADVIGRKLTLDGRPFEVVGVTAPDFYGIEVGRVFDVAVPLCTEPIVDAAEPLLAMRHGYWLNVIGRLKPGWTLDKASANLGAISAGVMQETLPTVYDEEVAAKYLENVMEAKPGANGYSLLRQNYEGPLVLLLAVSGIVLLIACANLANLMLARASVKEREIAVRLALGASRRRLVRQLVTEDALLAAVGVVLGILLARGLSAAMIAYLVKANDHIYLDRPLDWHVLGFSIGVAGATCVLFALLPAYKATRLAPAQVMNSAGRAATASRERFGMRRVLAVTQIALSLVLVVAAVLFVRTLQNLLNMDTGFDRNHVLVVDMDFSRIRQTAGETKTFEDQLLASVRGIPGVESAAETSVVPLSGNGWNNRILVDNVKSKDFVWMANISPQYFKTLSIPMLAGRDFGEQEQSGGEKAAIVDEIFARTYFPNVSAIGKTFKIDVFKGDAQHEYRIIGVVKHANYDDLREKALPTAYYPLSQADAPEPGTAIMIRSGLPLSALKGSVDEAIHNASGQVVYQYSVLRTSVNDALLRERLLANLSGAFAILAGILASVGLYGVIAYIVVRRTNEIGVRIAMGALPSSIVSMIVSEAAKLLALGVLGGVVLAVLLMRAATSLLYGLNSYDPMTIAISIAGLAVVTIAASLVPAVRAARLDPMVALREQ